MLFFLWVLFLLKCHNFIIVIVLFSTVVSSLSTSICYYKQLLQNVFYHQKSEKPKTASEFDL